MYKEKEIKGVLVYQGMLIYNLNGSASIKPL
jgi:hypothetical protein